jgi:uncharacterized repeat protein (TIGR01451 family)
MKFISQANFKTPNFKKINVMLATSLTLAAQLGGLWIVPAQADQADICATPGADGPVPTGGQVGTFYPGTAASVSSGSQSLVVGAATGAPQIKKGDLLMIIQMQGADIDSTNTASYGDGNSTNTRPAPIANYPTNGIVNGNLDDTNFTAGYYEYAVASSDVALGGGTLTLNTPLLKSYRNTDNTSDTSQGQRRFQVIRVPQYSSSSDPATSISGVLTAPVWDGLKGGVFAIDVAGTLNFATAGTIDMTGKGFRGGGGRQLGGDSKNPPLYNSDLVTLSSRSANGSKGEGIAGTPKYLIDGTLLKTGTTEGYPNGSYGRGAPGNAGGGGNDGYPQTSITTNGITTPVVSLPATSYTSNYGNGQNAGGGGGSNGGTGGKGGRTWATALPYGGDGGSTFPAKPTRLVMGGGGGAGSTNDGTSTGTNGALASSGAPGGGIVMVRAAAITGSGSIISKGLKPAGTPYNDASGGGGAGGSILVVTDDGSTAGLTLNADGGDGGTNLGGGNPKPHGPGGGGSGGVIYNSSSTGQATSISVAPGAAGTTYGGDYGGATAGTGTTGSVSASPTDTVTMISGANCLLKTTKSTSTPGPLAAPGVATYTITVTNPAGLKRPEARDIDIQDAGLPAGFTHTPAAVTPVYLGGASGPATVTGTGGATPLWTGTAAQPFKIPPGGSIAITFNADIASTVIAGKYNNGATATAKYINTSAGSVTLSPSAVTSTYDGAIVSNTADDVTIAAVPRLRLVKRITGVQKSGATTITPTPGYINDPADVNDDPIVPWNGGAATYLQGVTKNSELPVGLVIAPKDTVEYTIYYLSDGSGTAKGVNLCDFVPANQKFVDDSLKLQEGAGANTTILNVGDPKGSFYPTTTATFPAACAGTNNGGGAAYVKVGDVQSIYGTPTPTTAYGKFSFLATVK